MRPAILTLAALILTPSIAAADPMRPVGRLPVVLHVAEIDGEPVAEEAWITEALRLANHHFEESGVSFGELERRALPERHAQLETIRDRHRLKGRLVRRAINVFVVDRIRDPVASRATRRAAAAQGFEPSGWLGGAHILSRRHRPQTYIIVSRRSRPLVVTHELGHFLGAPHDRDPENIMSYGRDRQRFSERQLRVFRMFARRYLRRGHLRRLRG